jgi:transcriptional regulator with XRE-family HTH domain
MSSLPSNRIWELRRSMRITAQQLADAIGTTPQHIGRLEKGTRPLTVEWMRKIADVLGVRPVALIASEQDVARGEEQLYEALLLDSWRRLTEDERARVARLILDLGRGSDPARRKSDQLTATG